MTSLYGLMRTYKLKEYIRMKNFGSVVFLARLLFENSILPELQRPPEAKTLPSSSDTISLSLPCTEVFCYCRGPEAGDMVGCDNKECMYKWFHLSCLNFKTFPKSKMWYCPDCRKLKTKKKKINTH